MRCCHAWIASLVAVAAVSTLADAAACTPSEVEAFTTANTTVAPRCVTVLRDFGTCADDCLAAFTSTVEAAPACSPATATATETLLQAASAVVAKCESARATFNASTAYAPTLASPDAPACTAAEETDWETRYGPDYLFGACSLEALTNRKCTTECLDKIQEGVKNAPRCRQGDGDMLFGEAVKFHLVRCLSARRERFDTNAVLQAAVTADSAGSAEKAPVGTTSKPTSSVPAVNTVTTAPPVAKPTSGATRTSAVTAIGVLAVMATTMM